jgi:hypothetical protein
MCGRVSSFLFSTTKNAKYTKGAGREAFPFFFSCFSCVSWFLLLVFTGRSARFPLWSEIECEAGLDLVSGLTWRGGSGQKVGGVVQTRDKLNRMESVTVRDGRNEAASAFGYAYDAQGKGKCGEGKLRGTQNMQEVASRRLSKRIPSPIFPSYQYTECRWSATKTGPI